MKELLVSLFDNRTWWTLSQNASVEHPVGVDPNNLWLEWANPQFTIFGTLVFFIVMKVKDTKKGESSAVSNTINLDAALRL